MNPNMTHNMSPPYTPTTIRQFQQVATTNQTGQMYTPVTLHADTTWMTTTYHRPERVRTPIFNAKESWDDFMVSLI